MSSNSPHPFRWPMSIDAVWLVMPIFVVAIRTLLQPIPMEDYWWHLVMGRLVDAGHLPTTNLFLFTIPADAPFYDQPWLAQWLMYRITASAGHVATVLVHCTLLVGTWIGLVAAASRRGGTPVAVGVSAALAYYISASTLMPRTQMFAYPLFVVLCGGLLWLAGADGAGRRRVALVGAGIILASAFWANVHGTFVLAPVLTIGVAFGWGLERKRRGQSLPKRQAIEWFVLCAGVVLSTAVAPGGFQNLVYPFKILLATKGNTATVLEWASPSFSSLPGLFFYASLAGSIIVLVRRRKHVTFPELAIFAPTALIAVGSVRGILWWSMAAVLIVAPHISALRGAAPREAASHSEGGFNVGLIATLAILVACALPSGPLFRAVDPGAIFGDGRLGDDGDASVLSDLHPAGLLPALRELDGRRVFHHQAVGGFLEWMLTSAEHPEAVAFIDQRLELVPQLVWDEYFDISRTRPGWEQIVERHHIEAFLVEAGEQELLVQWLDASPNHVVAAEDRMWRLYVVQRTE